MRMLLAVLLFSASLVAQVPGGSGRTTGAQAGGSGSSTTFSPGLGTITCTGTTCTDTSSTVSPSSRAVSGNLTFVSTHDATFSVGGSSGGGTGQLQVSCNGGTSWMSIATGSGSVGGSVTYGYSAPVCSGVSNLDALQFRSILGGGGASGFNMSFTAPSTVTISW
jgi:hypothetical protein